MPTQGGAWLINSQLQGIELAIKGLKTVEKLHVARLIQGTSTMAAMIFIRSQLYVPVDTGQLKASGDWGLNYGGFVAIRGGFEMYSLLAGKVNHQEGVSFSVQYGAPYALFVHENEDAAHAYPTGAKFISRAVQEIVAENDNHIPWNESFTVTGGPVQVF